MGNKKVNTQVSLHFAQIIIKGRQDVQCKYHIIFFNTNIPTHIFFFQIKLAKIASPFNYSLAFKIVAVIKPCMIK